jgi:hypothetical protein
LTESQSFVLENSGQISSEQSFAFMIPEKIQKISLPFRFPTAENSLLFNTSIKKEKNIFGNKGPRKFQIIIPAFKDNEYSMVRPAAKSENLNGLYQAGKKNIVTMVNNPPQWSEGRLNRASGVCLGFLQQSQKTFGQKFPAH